MVLFFFSFILLHDFGAKAYAATGRSAGRVNPKVPPGRKGLPGLSGSSMQSNPSQFTSNFGFYAQETEGERFRNVFTTSGRMVLVRNEASVPGDVPIVVQRIYSTQNTDSTYFSTGWELNYDIYLSVIGAGTSATLTLNTTLGQSVQFVQDLSDGGRGGGRDTPLFTYVPPDDEATGILYVNGFLNNKFVAKRKDGSQLTFELKGAVSRLTKIEAPDTRNYVSLTYNLSNKPTKIENSNSNYVELEYDVSGRISTSSTIDGRDWSYSYDLSGRLDEVTRPDETTEGYDYDLQGRLDEVTDAESETTDYVYDVNNKLTSITDRTGEETTFSYGATNTTITLPEDNTLVYGFDGDGYTTRIFDGLDNYIEITRDATTANITCVKDREGAETDYEWECPRHTGNCSGYVCEGPARTCRARLECRSDAHAAPRPKLRERRLSASQRSRP